MRFQPDIGEIEIEKYYCKSNSLGMDRIYTVMASKHGWAILFPKYGNDRCSVIWNRNTADASDNFQTALERLYEEYNGSALDFIQVFDYKEK